MNCDLAFDLMTDPAGCGSQALQSHLAHCPRCRQMQETLAPALDWLSDSNDAEDSEPLPPSLTGFQAAGVRAPSFATVESLEIARESAAALSVRSAPVACRYMPSSATLARSAALIAFGALAAFVCMPGSPPAGPAADDRDCLRREAAAAAVRSTAEFKVLAAICATCHEPAVRVRPADRRSGALEPRTFRDISEARAAFQRLWPMRDAVETPEAAILSTGPQHGRPINSLENALCGVPRASSDVAV